MSNARPRVTVESLIRRARRTTSGFGDLRRAADEVVANQTRAGSLASAKQLFASEVYQARMVATFIFGLLAAQSREALSLMRERVSQDPDWRVQEILAQAFDRYCALIGYERALPSIKAWLHDPNPPVRRAVSEGLRIWTRRPYFREHPDQAIALLSALRADPSEYVRKSAGNALRDISRMHPDLIRAELRGWVLSDRATAQTHKLASRFIGD